MRETSTNRGVGPEARDVLVVADDPDVRRNALEWLRSARYEVREASDADRALKMVAEKCPTVLVADWDMTSPTGADLCRQLRRMDLPHHLYVLILAAHADADHVQIAHEAGADDFLQKPGTCSELLARVRQAQFALDRRNHQTNLAETDHLTGVLNRRAFDQQCDREISRANRYQRPLSCALLDVDLFKQVNDTYGHTVGDVALRRVAEVLNCNSRQSDYLARYGGDEFCVLLTEVVEEDAVRWAERIRAAVANLAIPVDGRTLHLKTTIGIAQCPHDVHSPAALIDLADQALRAAKHAGGDRVRRFSSIHESAAFGDISTSDIAGTLATICAGQVMTTPIVCLEQGKPLKHAADLFLRIRINSAPVVNDEGQLVGIISEKDLLHAGLRQENWNMPIRDVMKTNVVTYTEDTNAMRIWEFLARVTIRRIVVVNQNREPVGVISRGGLLRWVGNWGMIRQNGQFRDADETHTRSHEGFRESAAAIARQARQLEDQLDLSLADDVPLVVHAATQLQHHIQDLLAWSQICYQFQPHALTGTEQAQGEGI